MFIYSPADQSWSPTNPPKAQAPSCGLAIATCTNPCAIDPCTPQCLIEFSSRPGVYWPAWAPPPVAAFFCHHPLTATCRVRSPSTPCTSACGQLQHIAGCSGPAWRTGGQLLRYGVKYSSAGAPCDAVARQRRRRAAARAAGRQQLRSGAGRRAGAVPNSLARSLLSRRGRLQRCPPSHRHMEPPEQPAPVRAAGDRNSTGARLRVRAAHLAA